MLSCAHGGKTAWLQAFLRETVEARTPNNMSGAPVLIWVCTVLSSLQQSSLPHHPLYGLQLSAATQCFSCLPRTVQRALQLPVKLRLTAHCTETCLFCFCRRIYFHISQCTRFAQQVLQEEPKEILPPAVNK